MASSNKEGKEKKAPKDEARSGAPSDNGALLRRLADELSALRADVDAMKSSAIAAPAESTKIPAKRATGDAVDRQDLTQRLRAPTDAAVVIAYAYRRIDGGLTDGHSGSSTSDGLNGILSVDDSQVARLAYALSSAQKVALLRALVSDGPQSAAQLGERTGLTTGSLYHHLRELTHADVIETAGRNRVALTERGLATTLVLFAQAANPAPTKEPD